MYNSKDQDLTTHDCVPFIVKKVHHLWYHKTNRSTNASDADLVEIVLVL